MTAFFQWINSLAPAPLKQAHPEVRRFIKFAIVGLIGAVVDFSVLNILVYVVGIPEEFANIISVTCAVVSNFTWNRLWTFPESQEHAVHTQFGQFLVVNLVGLAINEFVFVVAKNWLFEPMFPTNDRIALNVAKACAIGIVLFWNFGANRFTTYRHIK
ncbi:MAG: GtrA family protein [Anaerolineae bacterium]